MYLILFTNIRDFKLLRKNVQNLQNYHSQNYRK